jgi:ABC-2 type transport system ATP-binding protein
MKKTLKSFSRGMRMKAALLSSLSYLPELVILDEPFSGLDPLARDQFVEGLMELASQKSFTMFLSTHDVSEVERLCDTVVFLHSGKISLVETTEDLLHRYRRIEARANEERPPTRIPDGMFSFCQEGRRIQYIQTRFKNDEAELCELQNVCPGSQLSSVSRMSLREIIVSLSGPKGARA